VGLTHRFNRLHTVQNGQISRATRRRSSRQPPTRRRMRIEPLEPRIVLSTTNSAISQSQKDVILDGLDGLVQWADDLETHDLAAALMPVAGQALGTSLDLSEALDTGLVQPIIDYFDNDPTPTTDELVTTLGGLSGTFGNLVVDVDGNDVTGGKDTFAGGSELVFDLVFGANRTVASNLGLGPEGNARGIIFDGATTVQLDIDLNFDISFGMDLDSGLAPADAFFLRVNDMGATATANAAGLVSVDINAGFFDASASGSMSLLADLDVDLTNPDSDARGNITLAELAQHQPGPTRHTHTIRVCQRQSNTQRGQFWRIHALAFAIG